MKNLKKAGAVALAMLMLTAALGGCAKKPGEGSASNPGSASVLDATKVDLGAITDPFLYLSGIPGDTVVAKAGEHDITAGAVLYHATYLADKYMNYYYMMGMTDLPWNDEIEGVTMKQAVLDDAVQTAALYAILPAIAQDLGITMDSAQVAETLSALDEIKDNLGSETGLNYALWQEPLTPALYEQIVTSAVLHTQITDGMYGPNGTLYPTDEDILKLFEDEKGYYTAKHILLKTVNTNETVVKDDGTTGFTPLDDATIASQRAKAEDILAQLNASDDPLALFDELMVQYSEDAQPDGTVNGLEGYTAAPGDMVPSFEEGALALDYDQISGIVESDYGYHIILRLPMEVNDSNRAQMVNEYIATEVDRLQKQWLEANPIEKTEAFAQIDLPVFYANINTLRSAIGPELEAMQQTQQPEGGDASTPEAPDASAPAASTAP